MELEIQKHAFLKEWKSERPYLTGAHLKIIAMILMLLSHIAQTNFLYSLGPEYWKLADIFVFIGRIPMPIYCFFTVQAVMFTKDIKKYFIRMFIFALISEIPFNLAFYNTPFQPFGQNVIFTLLIGAVSIYYIDRLLNKNMNLALKFIAVFLTIMASLFLARVIMSDYDSRGVLAIILLYFARNSRIGTALAIAVGFYFEFQVYGWVYQQTYGFVYLAIPLILLYNGERGKQNKWAFYIFYPAHLLILYLLKLLII